MYIGFLGLGKMGQRMVAKLVDSGHEVVVWNRSLDVVENFIHPKQNFSYVKDITDFAKLQKVPHVFWLMLPAGEPTESVLQTLTPTLQQGDIVIDGGNAFYKDTDRRFDTFKKIDVHFLGIGVSGGILAPKNGFPLMVGGSASGYKKVKPILDSLAKPHGGHAYCGPGGAGHFVKMVHNAIEYSYMQGIGEGFGILERSPYKLNLLEVAQLFTKNTLISGFMMERTVDVLTKDPNVQHIVGVIGKASGDTIWAVEEAKKEKVIIENIAQALEFRNRSEKDKTIQKSFAAKMVAALRNAFGGHEVKGEIKFK